MFRVWVVSLGLQGFNDRVTDGPWTLPPMMDNKAKMKIEHGRTMGL